MALSETAVPKAQIIQDNQEHHCKDVDLPYCENPSKAQPGGAALQNYPVYQVEEHGSLAEDEQHAVGIGCDMPLNKHE